MKISKFIILFSFLILGNLVKSQNLFDEKHSIEFANYLLKTNQFNLAAEEFERLCYFAPNNLLFSEQLLSAYIKAGSFDIALNRYTYFNDSIKNQVNIRSKYYKLLSATNQYQLILNDLETNKLFSSEKISQLKISALMLNKNYSAATNFAQTNHVYYPKLNELSNDFIHLKSKSPYIGALFSAVIPGSGKIYAHEWKDGLLSLLFIGATSFQTYRGFRKSGIKSTYGWIFGSLSFSFYLGNIYGSAQSVKHYNQHIYNDFYKKVELEYSSDF
jgi:hypothetical protein